MDEQQPSAPASLPGVDASGRSVRAQGGPTIEARCRAAGRDALPGSGSGGRMRERAPSRRANPATGGRVRR
eukprot:5054233-Alexandrium_andersonii.AAC.1